MSLCLLQRFLRFFPCASCGRHCDVLRAHHQLFIALLHIHHQVFIGFSHADHTSGGNHIQHHLLAGPRLQTGGTGQDLRAGLGLYGKPGLSAHLRTFITGDTYGFAADGCCIFQAVDHIGRPSGSCQPDHDILAGKAQFFQILFTQRPAVLRTFHRFYESAFSAGYQPHHPGGIHAEGRRAFHRIQHAQPSAGSGSQVDNPAAGLQAFRRPLDRRGYFGQHLFHRLHHFFVFLVHRAGYFQRSHFIQRHSIRIPGLCC